MKKIIFLFMVAVLVSLTACQDQAQNTKEQLQEKPQIANPASKFCTDQGFENSIVTSPDGSQTGYCRVKVNENIIECDEWEFYRGECPACEEYCSKMPHIECIGDWNITGKYPKCSCDFVCKVEEVKPIETVASNTSALGTDDVLEKYRQCIKILLDSMGEEYDAAEFKSPPGAKEFSLLSCLSVQEEFEVSESKYNGPVYSGKIIDAHNHLFYDGKVSDVISKMDQANLDKIVIMTGESLPLAKQYPDRIIPFYWFYEGSIDSLAAKAEDKLKEGYKGIGEINLRHAAVAGITAETKNPADSEIMKKLADLAAKYDVPISIHHESNFDELERLLAYNSKAKIILSHAGMGDINVPFRMDRLLSKYPNLYADLSTRIVAFQPESEKDELYYLLLPDGKINPLWKHVLEKYPGRFMVGGDYYVQDRDSLKKGTDEFRKALGQLDKDTAEKIAYKNILSILPS